jgi:hypothetical protein
MPRYVVERTFHATFDLPVTPDGAATCQAIAARNARDEVTWIHSYVSSDRRKWFCIYEGPTPEAVRHAAVANRLPVDAITEVRLLDPYFHW